MVASRSAATNAGAVETTRKPGSRVREEDEEEEGEYGGGLLFEKGKGQ